MVLRGEGSSQIMELAVRGFLLSLIEVALLRQRGFRVVSEYRYRGEEGVLSLPVVIGRLGDHVIQPEIAIYIQRVELRDGRLVADADIAIDARLVMRESLEAYDPGVYNGIFYYYGPRSSGSTSLVIVLNTAVSRFRIDGMTVYEYYKLFGDEYVPNSNEKTVIIAKYKDGLYRRHAVEYEYVENEMERVCAKDLDEIAKELSMCILTRNESFVSQTEVENAINECLRRICGDKWVEARIRFVPYPASQVRAWIEEDEEREMFSIDERVKLITKLRELAENGLRRVLDEYRSRNLVDYESIEGVRIGAKDCLGIKIIPDRFYENGAKQGLYPPPEIINAMLKGSSDGKSIKIVGIRFRVKDQPHRHVCVSQSPIYALENKGYEPLPGKRDVNLIVFYPENLGRNVVDKALNEVVKAYASLNLGGASIKLLAAVPTSYRKALETIRKQCQDLIAREGRENILKKYHFLCIVDDRRPLASQLYYDCKKVIAEATEGAHATIVETSTLDKLVSSNDKEKVAANIALAIYKEVLIQTAKVSRDELLATPWTLCYPADGKGLTMYMGIDVGRAEKATKANPAICTAIYDSYGSMLGATVLAAVKGEKIDRDDIKKAVIESLYLVSELDPPLRPEPSRIVILRDGYPSKEELIESRIELDNGRGIDAVMIGVVKKHNTRVYVRYEDKIYNVPPLMALYLGKYMHKGYNAHHVLLVSSHWTASGGKKLVPLYRPLLLVIPDNYVENEKEALNIAIEIGMLTKLNFENALTGLNKLPLPIQVADILAKLVAHDLPLKSLIIVARKRIPIEQVKVQSSSRTKRGGRKHKNRWGSQ